MRQGYTTLMLVFAGLGFGMSCTTIRIAYQLQAFRPDSRRLLMGWGLMVFWIVLAIYWGVRAWRAH